MRTLLGAFLLIVASNSFGQGWPIDPALLAKDAKVGALMGRAEALLLGGKAQEAAPIFEEAAAIEATYPQHRSGAAYGLARALTALGRFEEARAAYKRSVRWDPKRQDLWVSGPMVVPLAMDYAILLAKLRQAEEAKALYYFGLRNRDPRAGSSHSIPIPFVVFFDPDPKGICWPYSAQNLEIAALMAKAPFMGPKDDEVVSQVRMLAPDWFYPVAFQAYRLRPGPKREQLLADAERLAKPGLERFLFKEFARPEPGVAYDPREWLKQTTVPSSAKAELEQIRRKIAIDYKPPI